jgi:DNA-binding transcriptional ArsR family regulator
MELHNNRDDDRATDIFAALADPTRARIVQLLAGGNEMRLSDLAGAFDSTRQTVTRHLDVLEAAGITTTERRGRERYTSLSEGAFDPVRDWLVRYDRFWDERLDTLRTLIASGEER